MSEPRQNPWSKSQVKSFAKLVKDRWSTGQWNSLWEHTSLDVRQALTDSVVLSIIAGNHDDLRISQKEVQSVRNEMYVLLGLTNE